nr:hypothetical protein CFP56_62552 [Quercus suber]
MCWQFHGSWVFHSTSLRTDFRGTQDTWRTRSYGTVEQKKKIFNIKERDKYSILESWRLYSLFRNAFVWNWGENVFAVSWKLGLSLNKSSDRLSWNSVIFQASATKKFDETIKIGY